MNIPPLGLEGDLMVPEDASGVVLFAHGSGSSRLSPRNRQVAETLQQNGLATLLMDLLSPDEDQRFNIELLSARLIHAVDWLAQEASTARLRLGLFGASTGAAAALVTAARRPDNVRAVVSRGGRPDLAGAALSLVDAPTLLIVGGRDSTVIDLNRRAFEQLRCDKDIHIVPGATHLFEEPGTLEKVSDLAQDWFLTYLH